MDTLNVRSATPEETLRCITQLRYEPKRSVQRRGVRALFKAVRATKTHPFVRGLILVYLLEIRYGTLLRPKQRAWLEEVVPVEHLRGPYRTYSVSAHLSPVVIIEHARFLCREERKRHVRKVHVQLVEAACAWCHRACVQHRCATVCALADSAY